MRHDAAAANARASEIKARPTSAPGTTIAPASTTIAAQVTTEAIERHVRLSIVKILAHGEEGRRVEFEAVARIDTPEELVAFRHGGILPYVLRQLVGTRDS